MIPGRQEGSMSRAFLAAAAAVSAFVLLSSCDKEKPTAPSLQATCSALPGTGNAPLPVAFALTVAGAQGPFSVDISYGDGSAGSDPDAPHTYAAAGSYVASFTVRTATQSARCAATVAVAAAPVIANQAPVPVYKTVPEALGRSLSGRAPYSIRFNECPTSDPESDRLWFSMDFDGDGHFDSSGLTGAACRQEHTYTAGTYFARICVHDVGPDDAPLHPDQCTTYTVVVTP
jgi:PKD repeat protein